jgi:hypothetical protein
MPEISRFFGIVIRMYFDDHNPPHIHAFYGDEEALFRIDEIGLLQGSLPGRATSMVTEWLGLHQRELLSNWDHAQHGEPVERVEPLK